MMKKNMQALMAAVALGVGVSAVPVWAQAPGQVPVDAGLQRQQQNQTRQENRQEKREQQREAKQEKRELKREREQLSNMPKPVRETLRAQAANGTDVD